MVQQLIAPLTGRLPRGRIELACPSRESRERPATQEGQPVRRYRRWWRIERTLAWFNKFRGLVVRWERHGNIYRTFVRPSYILITLWQYSTGL